MDAIISNEMDKKIAVANWLQSQFIAWINQEGEHKKISELAKYLDVNRSLLSKWLKAEVLPGNANVIRIANKFGPEIYDLLEWPRPLDVNNN